MGAPGYPMGIPMPPMPIMGGEPIIGGDPMG
eukprot:CAMPEP_0173417770 /NCGR_PEP_ID=MMETSP1357-20121228/27_1 /TAXON_ID=77926 /ORGANISM="Hemiselmis rufescens, Strain PCC563" /LENGTH=30 /DNA_ID= /DNA_START= /DNA_END= /DNA_ORIENTATION=